MQISVADFLRKMREIHIVTSGYFNAFNVEKHLNALISLPMHTHKT